MALALAWLALGRAAASVRELRVIAAAWSVPLFAGPVLFSHDVYSYLAQGEILRLGLNPYHVAPAALPGLGHAHFLSAVSPFWHHTTAPYGPLFLGPVALIVSITGAHLTAGVLLVRLLDLTGVGLLALFVPRLARATGADPARATWLTVASPLVLLELIAAAHNDALMVGLLVAGVTLAVERRWLAAIVLCAFAAAVKLPAAAAILLIVVAWARTRTNRRRVLLQSALATAVPVLAIGAITGVGFSWLSTSLISTPQKVRLAITPSTGVGYTVAHILHLNAHHLESALAVAALCLTVAVGLLAVYRTRIGTLPRELGVVLLVAALCGPAAWPWYLTWSLAFLAVWRGWALALPALTVVSVCLVKPDGILALPLQSAPAVVAVYLAVMAVFLIGRSRRSYARERPARNPGSPLVESR